MSQQWCEENRGRRRVYQKNYLRGLKEEVIKHYSPTAICQYPGCDCSDIRALSMDHINGGGRKHKKGAGLYFWLRNKGYPPGYQVLCMNHQAIKRDENFREIPGRKAHEYLVSIPRAMFE